VVAVRKSVGGGVAVVGPKKEDGKVFLERDRQRLEHGKGLDRGRARRHAEGDPEDDRAGVIERLGLEERPEGKSAGRRPQPSAPGRVDDQAAAAGECLRRMHLFPVVTKVFGLDEVAEEGGSADNVVVLVVVVGRSCFGGGGAGGSSGGGQSFFRFFHFGRFRGTAARAGARQRPEAQLRSHVCSSSSSSRTSATSTSSGSRRQVEDQAGAPVLSLGFSLGLGGVDLFVIALCFLRGLGGALLVSARLLLGRARLPRGRARLLLGRAHLIPRLPHAASRTRPGLDSRGGLRENGGKLFLVLLLEKDTVDALKHLIAVVIVVVVACSDADVAAAAAGVVAGVVFVLGFLLLLLSSSSFFSSRDKREGHTSLEVAGVVVGHGADENGAGAAPRVVEAVRPLEDGEDNQALADLEGDAEVGEEPEDYAQDHLVFALLLFAVEVVVVVVVVVVAEGTGAGCGGGVEGSFFFFSHCEVSTTYGLRKREDSWRAAFPPRRIARASLDSATPDTGSSSTRDTPLLEQKEHCGPRSVQLGGGGKKFLLGAWSKGGR